MSPIVTGNVRPRVRTIGTLYKGAPKPNDRQPGPNLSYFRFESEIPGVAEAFYDAFGAEPTSIPVRFWHQSKDANWDVWFQEWKGRKLIHQCDGVTCNRVLLDDDTYSYDPVPCPYAAGTKKRTKANPGCALALTLYVEIPALTAKGKVGQVVLRTGGWADYRNVEGTFLWAAASYLADCRSGSYLLTRAEYTKRWKDGQGAHAMKDWCVDLVPDASTVALSGQLFHRAMLDQDIDNEPVVDRDDVGPDYDGIVDTETGEIMPMMPTITYTADEIAKLKTLILGIEKVYSVSGDLDESLAADSMSFEEGLPLWVMGKVLPETDMPTDGFEAMVAASKMSVQDLRAEIARWFDCEYVSQLVAGLDYPGTLNIEGIRAAVTAKGRCKLDERAARLIEATNEALDLLRSVPLEEEELLF